MPHLFQNGVRPRLEVDLVRRGQGTAGQPALRLLHPAALPAQVGRRRLHQRGVPPLSAKGPVPLFEYEIEMKCTEATRNLLNKHVEIFGTRSGCKWSV